MMRWRALRVGPLLRSSGDLPSGRNEGDCRMPPSTKGEGTEAADISAKWGWFIVLGIVMIALGAIARLSVGSDVAAGTILIGVSPLVGGAFQIIHAFLTKEWYG